jgi:hypothetical protein
MDNIHDSSSTHLLKNGTTAGFDFDTYIKSISTQNDQSSYLPSVDMPSVYHICCCLIFALFFLTITIGIAYVGYRQQVTERKPSKVNEELLSCLC